jgi:hypothetical protein
MDWMLAITFDTIVMSAIACLIIREAMILALPDSIAGPGAPSSTRPGAEIAPLRAGQVLRPSTSSTKAARLSGAISTAARRMRSGLRSGRAVSTRSDQT